MEALAYMGFGGPGAPIYLFPWWSPAVVAAAALAARATLAGIARTKQVLLAVAVTAAAVAAVAATSLPYVQGSIDLIDTTGLTTARSVMTVFSVMLSVAATALTWRYCARRSLIPPRASVAPGLGLATFVVAFLALIGTQDLGPGPGLGLLILIFALMLCLMTRPSSSTEHTSRSVAPSLSGRGVPLRGLGLTLAILAFLYVRPEPHLGDMGWRRVGDYEVDYSIESSRVSLLVVLDIGTPRSSRDYSSDELRRRRYEFVEGPELTIESTNEWVRVNEQQFDLSNGRVLCVARRASTLRARQLDVPLRSLRPHVPMRFFHWGLNDVIRSVYNNPRVRSTMADLVCVTNEY